MIEILHKMYKNRIMKLIKIVFKMREKKVIEGKLIKVYYITMKALCTINIHE
jgi:hypothetical protein